MTHESERSDPSTLPPDEAFDVLANETRIGILRVLGRATAPMTFSELYEQVEYETTANFNYHLDKLVGHFVSKTDDGYELRPAGSRVVEAVLSGTVTEDPALDPEQIHRPCQYCGAPIEVEFHQNRLHLYCPECPGTYESTALPGVSVDPDDRGYLGMLNIPPSGTTDRSPEAVVEAATIWNHLLLLRPANGLCPRCSASIGSSASVCTDHDTSDGLCSACGRRHCVAVEHRCPNCIFAAYSSFADWLLASFEFVEFLVGHDINPVCPTPEDKRVWMDYDEDVRSEDPFEVAFTFTIDDDALTVTVDDDLEVVEVTEGARAETV